MKFVGRFSGIVTYRDDSHDQFAAHLDERGNVSVNAGVNDTPNSSNIAILEVQNSNNWLEDMLGLVSNSLALSPTGTPSKVVTGATMQFSGRVSRDNQTWEDFAVQYDRKADGELILNSSGTGGTVDAYDEFTEETLKAWLEPLVGEGNVTAP